METGFKKETFGLRHKRQDKNKKWLMALKEI